MYFFAFLFGKPPDTRAKRDKWVQPCIFPVPLICFFGFLSWRGCSEFAPTPKLFGVSQDPPKGSYGTNSTAPPSSNSQATIGNYTTSSAFSAAASAFLGRLLLKPSRPDSVQFRLCHVHQSFLFYPASTHITGRTVPPESVKFARCRLGMDARFTKYPSRNHRQHVPPY